MGQGVLGQGVLGQGVPGEGAKEFGAVLLGFDVEGFSRTVEKAALRHGRAAGELAAQSILAGEHLVTDLARQAGFRFADALGDGAVYLRAQETPTARDARALRRLREALKYAHLRGTGMAIRAAWAHGPVRLMRPRATMLEHRELLWGPAVAQLHTALSRRPRGRRSAPEGPSSRPNLTNPEGEISEMTFVFLRLCRGDDWARVDEGEIDDALGLIGRWADRLGGRLERITHDEKGLHVRVGLPGVDTPEREWRRRIEEPQVALRRMGLDGAVAAAGGTVYRGPSEHGSTIVHGGAVNRAAKLCAALPAGGLALDSSLDGPSGFPGHPNDAVVGREVETRQAWRWLGGGGPRMVILSGETGIGKSHLLRRLLAMRAADTQAFVAGAPARMLDPLGAWFELLDQGLRRRSPGLDDRAWGLQAFASAGLDPLLLPLCARAFPSAPAASAATAALTGGERASRTHEGMIALAGALAREGPLLIAIDDLQDLDDASLRLTLSILDRGLPVRILATGRWLANEDRLADLRGHLSTLEIPLPPLSDHEIGALVDLLAPDGVDAREVMNIAGGNPFEAIQAALALADDGTAQGERTLGAILDRRLDRLDLREREVLRALAIADRACTAADIDAIDPPRAGARASRETLARLERAKLVESVSVDPEAWQPAHRLLAESVRRRTPAGVYSQLSLGVARRLTRNRATGGGAPAAEIARHWARGGARGRAAVLYERAARAAAADGADGVCARLLSLALELFDGEPERPRPRRAVRWLAELSRAQWSLGLVDTANLTARQAVARARGVALSPGLRDSAAAACAMRAETGQFLGNLGELLVGSLEAGRFGAANTEGISAQGRGLSALGYVLGLARLDGAANRVLRRGERMASGADPRPAAFALTARAILHFIHADWSPGEAALARARDICGAWPQHHLMEVIETTLGLGAHLRGDGDRALTHFDALAARAGARGSRLHLGWADYASAQTLLALDQPHEGWARLAAAEDHLGPLGDRQSHHICLGLRARLAWVLGDTSEALSAAARCGALSRTLPPTNYSSTEAYSAPALVGAMALATGASANSGIARRLVRRHLPDLQWYALVFPIARPRLALVKAVIAGVSRPERAVRRLGVVAAGAGQRGLHFEAALARQLGADIAHRS